MTDLTIEQLQDWLHKEDAYDFSGSRAISEHAVEVARQLLATMKENARLRSVLESSSKALELLAYTSAGNNHGLSQFCAGLAGSMQFALQPNEVSDAG